jgi:purine-binding chemotaxis protein CheW
MRREAAVDSAGSQTAIVCSVGRVLCSLPLASVVETFRPLPIEAVAGAPPFVLGLSLVRGSPVPVVDLCRLVTGDPGNPRRFVVVQTDERKVALAVDSVNVRPIAADRMLELPPLLRDAGTEVISAIGRLDSALFMVLQATRIIPPGFFEDTARRLAS